MIVVVGALWLYLSNDVLCIGRPSERGDVRLKLGDNCWVLASDIEELLDNVICKLVLSHVHDSGKPCGRGRRGRGK